VLSRIMVHFLLKLSTNVPEGNEISCETLSAPSTVACDSATDVQGLRLHDNPALKEAATDATKLYPVFCLDPWFVETGYVGANRLNFLLQSLECLHQNLEKRGSRLIVLKGDPKEVIPGATKALKADVLVFEKDTESYALERDKAVSKALTDAGCEVRRMHYTCSTSEPADDISSI
jgi:deoxyribodipyrimidine photolyase